MSMPHMPALNSPTADRTRKSPADAFGNFQRAITFARANFPQRAAVGVGRREDIFLVFFAELLLEQIAEENEL